MTTHHLIIQLAIAYTLAGIFIFTAVTTCLSLVGWTKIVNPQYQNKLFYVLILELAVIGVSFFSGFLKFNPDTVAKAAVADARTQLESRSIDQVLQALATNSKLGTDNIAQFDVELAFAAGKLPEAMAIFKNPDAAEVKRRQFAVHLVHLKRLSDAFAICSVMTNRAEIRNVAVVVVNQLHPASSADTDHWKFLCDIYPRFTDRQRDEIFQKMNDRGIERRCQWSEYKPTA